MPQGTLLQQQRHKQLHCAPVAHAWAIPAVWQTVKRQTCFFLSLRRNGNGYNPMPTLRCWMMPPWSARSRKKTAYAKAWPIVRNFWPLWGACSRLMCTALKFCSPLQASTFTLRCATMGNAPFWGRKGACCQGKYAHGTACCSQFGCMATP